VASNIAPFILLQTVEENVAEVTLVKTGRSVALWLREHRHNLKKGLLEKSKLAQYAYEENHRVRWDDARILETESNSKYRK
jgi:hypothetical protein